MNELSLYILDLTQNSVSAGAAHVTITIEIDSSRDVIIIVIADDGKGMDEEFLKRVTSPFTTTRTTRKVGLGIPMIKELCEACEGAFSIESTPGVGTRLHLSFRKSHIDLPPMGNLADTIAMLVSGSPVRPEFVLSYRNGGEEFVFDTSEIRAALGDVPLDTPEVVEWMRQYLLEGIEAAGKLP